MPRRVHLMLLPRVTPGGQAMRTKVASDAGQRSELAAVGNIRAGAEDVIVPLLDRGEDRRVELARRQRGQSPSRRQRRDSTPRLGVEVPCASHLKGEQFAKSAARSPAQNRLGVAAECRQLVQRKVESTAASILTHVAQDVRQLHGNPEIDRVWQRRLVLATEDRRHHETDRSRHVIAVASELVPRRKAARPKIHPDSRDEIPGGRHRHPVLGSRGRERDRNGMRRGRELPLPGVERAAAAEAGPRNGRRCRRRSGRYA